MKKIELDRLEKISANGRGQSFLGGLSCGYGIGVLLSTGWTGAGAVVGAAMAIVGCATVFGDW